MEITHDEPDMPSLHNAAVLVSSSAVENELIKILINFHLNKMSNRNDNIYKIRLADSFDRTNRV
jgi:hypothetical protein